MVDSVDAMKKERDEVVKKLAAAVQEANVFKECLEGRFGVTGGGKASKKGAAAAASKTCPPCNKLYTAKIEAIKKNHADEINKLQLAVKQWTVKYDARLEAHVFSHRFRDRENELRQRVEVLELELCKVGNELREKKANFDTHMVSTLKHKAIAKELAAMKENFELAKSRVVELEKSVMQVVFFIITFSNQPLTLSPQDSVVADLSKKHHAQMLRAKRVHAISRERAAQLAVELDTEQLRAHVSTMFEEDLLFAYRSLRAEYNRDVGRVPVTRRPRQSGGETWLDGVSEGEPGVE